MYVCHMIFTDVNYINVLIINKLEWSQFNMKDYNNLYSSCSNCKHKFSKEICNECELGLKWEYDEKS